MSLPKFPENDPLLTRESVINQVISSIAMEELGLSHIINAEGEKIQYALGTIDGVSGPQTPPTIEEILNINKSIHETLNNTMINQFILKDKLQSALEASVMQGPAGPVGTILDSYDTLEDLEREHPHGKQGDTYLVSGALYVWDVENDVWKSVGNLIGPTGPQGPAGPLSTILGSYNTYDELVAAHPTGTLGDIWLVGGEVYTWLPDPGEWHSVGDFMGPTGPQGATGAVSTILDTYISLEALQEAHPSGEQGDTYIVGDGDLYVWKAGATDWESVGNLRGPTGATGEMGARGSDGIQGIQGPTGLQGIPGEAGTSGVIKGVYADETELRQKQPTGVDGEFYLVGDIAEGYELYVWNSEGEPPDWVSTGPFKGTVGPMGPEGQRGANSIILGSYGTYDELKNDHPTGSIGESYFVGAGNLHTWKEEQNDWVFVGDLMGPTGTFETAGTLFTVYGNNGGFDVDFEHDLHFKSSTLDIKVNAATSTVNIEDPSVTDQDRTILFNSVSVVNLATDGVGQRSPVIAVGVGNSRAIDNNMEPMKIPGTQIIPIKLFSGGTITQLHASLSTTTTNHSDGPLVLYAQLFAAPTLTSSEFFPVPDTLINMGTMSTGTPLGTLFSGEKTDISIAVEPGTQYILGFYCTGTLLAIARQDVYLGGWMKVE